jgi:hypothetical protein
VPLQEQVIAIPRATIYYLSACCGFPLPLRHGLNRISCGYPGSSWLIWQSDTSSATVRSRNKLLLRQFQWTRPAQVLSSRVGELITEDQVGWIVKISGKAA